MSKKNANGRYIVSQKVTQVSTSSPLPWSITPPSNLLYFLCRLAALSGLPAFTAARELMFYNFMYTVDVNFSSAKAIGDLGIDFIPYEKSMSDTKDALELFGEWK
jgi:hypothetical protein